MVEDSIHIVAHYDSKTDQAHANVFEDPDKANLWAKDRRESRDVEGVLYKVVDLPDGFADDVVDQWIEDVA